MDAITATDVTKTYGDVTALEDLSLSVEAGATFGLLGTNGAGKTTLFKLLVSHIRPDAGSLAVAGRDVTEAGPDIRRAVGYLPERAGFPPALTGREVLAYHARMRGIRDPERRERIDAVLETVGLAGAADRTVEGYSNGMNRRLGLATALLPEPDILLLDEPTAGLDPIGVAAFHRIVGELRDESELTVVLSSHVLTEVEALCDSIAVLHEGRLRTAGSVADLRADLGEALTVRVRLESPAGMERALDLATERECTVASAEADRLEVACDPETVPDLLAALTERVSVAGYEVREPGLDRVFEAALEEGSA